MDNLTFISSSTADNLARRSGQAVTLMRPLTLAEADIFINSMYRVQFADGAEIDAFEDELQGDLSKWAPVLGTATYKPSADLAYAFHVLQSDVPSSKLDQAGETCTVIDNLPDQPGPGRWYRGRFQIDGYIFDVPVHESELEFHTTQ